MMEGVQSQLFDVIYDKILLLITVLYIIYIYLYFQYIRYIIQYIQILYCTVTSSFLMLIFVHPRYLEIHLLFYMASLPWQIICTSSRILVFDSTIYILICHWKMFVLKTICTVAWHIFYKNTQWAMKSYWTRTRIHHEYKIQQKLLNIKIHEIV